MASRSGSGDEQPLTGGTAVHFRYIIDSAYADSDNLNDIKGLCMKSDAEGKLTADRRSGFLSISDVDLQIHLAHSALQRVRMKFLYVPQLAAVTNCLTQREIGDVIYDGRVESYSCTSIAWCSVLACRALTACTRRLLQ